jgi:allantoate deiminase
MKDRARRAIAECQLIAGFTEEPGRTTRRFLTPPIHAVHAHLRARMEAMGMVVQVDAAGNLRGLWQPANAERKRLILGSHIDTVPDAGAYDGVLGVTLALEWVQIAQELALPRPIEVIAFSEEEGVRFGVPFLGSRAVAGIFDMSMLALSDSSAITLGQSIREFGLDPDQIAGAVVGDNALGFIEMHIEQGPVLEAEGLPLAVVEGIAGQTRMQFRFKGHANHAGTTPMHLRRDALAAAAEWMAAVELLAQSTEGLVATVGKISVEPNAANVIPGGVTLSLDVRHMSDEARARSLVELGEKAAEICMRRGIEFESVEKMNQPSVHMHDGLTARLLRAVEAAGFDPRKMPSGAGHDAMVMAARVPTTMLFLRSPGGISHHPAESVREEDVEAALLVGRKFLEQLAAENE